MAAVMAAAALVAFFALEQGLQEDPGESDKDPSAGNVVEPQDLRAPAIRDH
jgi:hypothetical protein